MKRRCNMGTFTEVPGCGFMVVLRARPGMQNAEGRMQNLEARPRGVILPSALCPLPSALGV